MKKIGILYGMEQTFPPAVADYINSVKSRGAAAEMISIGALPMAESLDYNVIFDRVAYEVPFYQSILKNTLLNGTRIVNNPFWGCAEDNFFHASLAARIGIRIPKTVVLPSKEHPPGTSSETLRNLMYPLNWEDVFKYIGFPAYIKPNRGNSQSMAYKVYNQQEFFSAYDLTGHNVMVLQESIDWDEYYRCYTIGKKHVRIISYDPTKPQHMRYTPGVPEMIEKQRVELERLCIKISTALGFDFNSVEFAVKDGVPYTIDFLNTVPNSERAFLGDENFEWLVKTTGDYLISLAKEGRYKSSEYSWSAYLRGPKSGGKKKRGPRLKKKEGSPAAGETEAEPDANGDVEI